MARLASAAATSLFFYTAAASGPCQGPCSQSQVSIELAEAEVALAAAATVKRQAAAWHELEEQTVGRSGSLQLSASPLRAPLVGSPGGMLESSPRVLSQQRRAAAQDVTYAEIRQQLATATRGSSITFTLAPGEVIEVEESLIVAGITVSISSPSPGATISRAPWANNSRIFEVRDAGHLFLSRVSVANGTSSGEDGGGILVKGESSILTAEFLAVTDCQVLDLGGAALFNHRGGGIAAIAGAELRLNGVQVERCRSNHGGGIALDGSSGVFTDCSITDCALNPAEHAKTSGAGIYMLSQSVVSWRGGGIANCSGATTGCGWAAIDSKFSMMDAIIAGCKAGSYGAGWLGSRFFGNPTAMSIGNLTNVSVSSCEAVDSSGGGFGVVGAGSTLFFANSVASDCHAGLSGGAFHLSGGGTAVLAESTVIGCTAQQGGAFAINVGGTVELTRSFVEACVADEEGGGVYVHGAGATFRAIDSSFVNCSCPDGDGGALSIVAGSASIVGGHSHQCGARRGGAMHGGGGQLSVSDHIFTEAFSDVQGGVLHVNHKTENALASLTNCVVVNAKSLMNGGAVSILAGAATVQNCRMEGSSSPLGGSFAVLGGKLSILRSNITGGEASIGGGILYVDGGDADVQGCDFSRGRSQRLGGTAALNSGTLQMVQSSIRDSVMTSFGPGAAVYANVGSLKLQDVQIRNCSMPFLNGGYIYVSEETRFRAEFLLVELDCGGGIAIVSGDPEQALDVAGLSLLPNECATSPNAAQVSNARFSGCSDHSACGVAAECMDVPVLLSLPDLTSPECSCTEPNYPLSSAVSATLAPYLRESSGGCATPRKAERVTVVGETVGTVVIQLHKGESYDAIPADNITLATAMAGSGISSAAWTSAVRYLPTSVPAWVHLQHESGFIPAEEEQMRLWVVATASGLAERSEAYQAHLDLLVTSQANMTLTVPIYLSVSASTVAAVWGMVPEDGHCSEATGAVSSMERTLDVQINVHFVACDVEMLPVQHRLPSVSDSREFSVVIRNASNEAYEGIDYHVIMDGASSGDGTSPGEYVVQLTFLHLGEYVVQLVLSNAAVAMPLKITTVCPTGRVPHGSECGCAPGTVYNGDTGVCEACPTNTYSNRTMRVDTDALCDPCPKDSVSPTASTSGSMCQCNEGFYSRTPDGLVHGFGDCLLCPTGTVCDIIGHTLSNLPLKAGYWRASNTSRDIKRCADYDSEAGSGCVGGRARSCKDNLDGPLCVLCKDGPGYYFNKNDRDCRECGVDKSYLTITVMLGVVFGLCLASGVLLYYCSLPAARAYKPKRRVLRAIMNTLRSFMVKIKMALSFFQVATLIPDVYQIQLPVQVEEVLNFFRNAIGFELDSWNVHISCYGDSGVYSQITFKIVWPIVAICFTPLIGLVLALPLKQTTLRELWELGRCRNSRGLIDAVLLQYAMPLTMIILFFAFPPVTSLAFRTFEKCTTFTDEVGETQTFLISSPNHYAVACPSDELSDAQSLALVAIFLYPVGVLVLCGSLLYIGRQTLLVEEQATPYTRSIAFLHAPFIPKFFYFELLDLTKKLVLIGFASLIEPGSLLQIMIAVIVSQLFLVLHLQSMPFRKPMDNILATMINLSLVVFFFWCSLLQTGALGDTDDLESGRLSGMGEAVSVLMIISIVGVLLVAVILFVLETAAKTAVDLVEKRKRDKWAGCTIDPPMTKWRGEKSYSCFLSHYKVEAASDARLLYDLLAKMLQYPVFLDSAKLTDLRELITHGVADCDVMLVLATKGYITRPWCLLEIVHATRVKTPIIIIDVKNSNYNASESLSYINNIEATMGADDPTSLELLHENLGPNLTELKQACTAVLATHQLASKQLVWNPNGSDSELIACLRDIIDAMAVAADSTLTWMPSETDSVRREDSVSRQSGNNSPWFIRRPSRSLEEAPALHIVCNCNEALADARVLQTEMAMRLGRLITTDKPNLEAPQGEGGNCFRAGAIAVLLSECVLHEPTTLIDIYQASRQERVIVPICLVGRGYDYKKASEHLSNLEAGLSAPKLAELQQRLEALSIAPGDTAVSVARLQALVLATLPRIIAVNWDPEGGRNQLEATVTSVFARLTNARTTPTSLQANPVKLSKSDTATRAAIRLASLRLVVTGVTRVESPEPPAASRTVTTV